ncbi:DNA cytosine methyltransferase [Lachnospiraceae bacterium JLR.KK009]|nr:DNA (cytosine-5-)-methyltransferase [Lachnospiraceae bacterium A2]
MPCAAIDLFCGIGGLTKGLSLSGVDVIAGIDIDESCRFAYEANNHAKFLCKDVSSVHGQDLEPIFPENTVRILVGCAPCQPFSRYSSRYRKEGHTDSKWKLLYSFGRIIRESLPDIVSMENVPNLLHEGIFMDFVGVLEETGYFVDYSIVYCPDYGVPQHRKRLVLLASRLGSIDLVPPIYHPDNYLTVRDAIGYLPEIKAGETDERDCLHCSSALSELNMRRIRQSVQGGTWRDWDDDLKLKCHKKDSGKTFPSVYGRMEWDKPSPTITTQFYGYGNGRFGHPEQDRAISLREGAILQSFPDDYIFLDEEHPAKKRELGTHIGNAVPVELGRAIGESIQLHVSCIGKG